MNPYDPHLARALAKEKLCKPGRIETYGFEYKFNPRRYAAYLLIAIADRLAPDLKAKNASI